MEINKTRRLVCGFVPLAVAVGVLPTRAFAQPNPYDTLIKGQYAAPIRLKQAGGRYLGHNFDLTAAADVWSLEIGAYDWHTGGKVIPYRGYWIFTPDGVKCWQAAGGAGPKLQYWNEDGRAAGNPQDWEIFNFEAVSPQDGTVRIKHKSGRYVHLVGNTFQLANGRDDAAVFTPEFVKPTEVQVKRFHPR